MIDRDDADTSGEAADSGGPRSMQKRREKFNKKHGDPTLTFCEEHYYRCPKRKKEKEGYIKQDLMNLYGLRWIDWVQGCEICVTSRFSTAYDIVTDYKITSVIDRLRDPWWFYISCIFIALPILCKIIVFNRTMRKAIQGWIIDRGWFGDNVQSDGYIVVVMYMLTSPIVFALNDIYMLVMYPWVSPSAANAAFLGTVEKLSPLIDMVEGFGQSLMQMYVFLRMQHLGRHTSSSLPELLVLSFLPCMLGNAKKIYDLSCDARRANMSLGAYSLEVFKGPLGYSAPFLALLTQRDEVSYQGMGDLTPEQQEQIFACLATRTSF